jgi:hypothetical protein
MGWAEGGRSRPVEEDRHSAAGWQRRRWVDPKKEETMASAARDPMNRLGEVDPHLA